MNAFLFYFIQLLIGIGVHSSVHDKRHYFGFLLVEYGIYISRVVRLARFMFPLLSKQARVVMRYPLKHCHVTTAEKR